MPCSRIVLRLLQHAESCGVREEIVGDLVEELARGRSPAWACRQLLAICAQMLVGRLRARARMTPQGVAVLLGAALMAGGAVVPIGEVVQAWLVLYCLTGTLSLFAHMASGHRPPDHSESGAGLSAE
jgi:hypothetical protein